MVVLSWFFVASSWCQSFGDVSPCVLSNDICGMLTKGKKTVVYRKVSFNFKLGNAQDILKQ